MTSHSPISLVQGSRVMIVVANSTTVQYPGPAGLGTTNANASLVRDEQLVEIDAVAIYFGATAGFLTFKTHAGVDLFRVRYPIISTQVHYRLGRHGLLVPGGFAVVASNAIVYTVFYRKCTGERLN